MSPPQYLFQSANDNEMNCINPVNLDEILSEFYSRYPDLAFQDAMRSLLKVYLLSQTPTWELSILENLYKKCIFSSLIYSNLDYNYCITTTTKNSRGEWWGQGKYGKELFSLFKTIKGCLSDWEAFYDVSKIMNMELPERNVVQIQSLEGESFIPDAQAYKIIYPQYADYALQDPSSIYDFKNSKGHNSFKLMKWESSRGPLLLFYTLQQYDKTGRKQWKFIAPPPGPHMIFNRNLIEQDKNKEVHIHDDIANTDLSEKVGAIGTWAGDLSISLDLDWTFLTGREVKYFFDTDNPHSKEIGIQLLKKFEEINTPLKLYLTYLGGVTRVCDDGQPLDKMKIQLGGEKKFEYIYEFPKSHYGLGLKTQEIKIAHTEPGEGSEDKEIEPEYIVKPLLEKKQLALIVAKPGVGKSMVAIDISMMIACGEKIGQWLSAPKSYVTLFIDSEIYDVNVQARKRLLMANYTNKEKIKTNFQYRRVREHRDRIDISNKPDQLWIEENWINPLKAEFVVFDNLVGLLPDRGAQSEISWGPTVRWFGELSAKGITVLLVHHANSIGGVAGTNTIGANIPVILSLTDPDESDQKTIIDIRITKGRDIFGKDRDPYSVEYCTNEKKTETLRKVQPLNPPDIEEDDQPVVPAADIPQNGLTDDQQELISQLALTENQKKIAKEMLEPALHAENGYIKPGMFIAEGKPDRSKGTIDKIIDKLCEKEQLKTSLDFKGKYYFPDNFPKGLPIDGPGPELTSE